MMKPIRALVIGARDDGKKRNIGGELCARLKSPIWDLSCVVTSTTTQIWNPTGTEKHVFNPNDRQAFRDLLKMVHPDVGFVCIPTHDQGETAWNYTEDLLDAAAIVSTAEKGMISFLPEKVLQRRKYVDFSAAVGGGNRFLYNPKLQHLRGRSVRIYAILNATLNMLGWVIGEGGSEDDAVLQAIDRGVAEPAKNGGTVTLASLVRGEVPDKVMKGCGFFNCLVAEEDRYLRPKDFGMVDVKDEDIERLLNPFESRRMILEITNKPKSYLNGRDLVVPLHAEIGEWQITMGFAPVSSGPVASWVKNVPDINNGVLLYVDGHRYPFGGPGAGRATVDALMEGALDKCNQLHSA